MRRNTPAAASTPRSLAPQAQEMYMQAEMTKDFLCVATRVLISNVGSALFQQHLTPTHKPYSSRSDVSVEIGKSIILFF
jgi:hypothetical protein